MTNQESGTDNPTKPALHLKRSNIPGCNYYRYTYLSEEDRKQLHTTLPSPIIKWSDYDYQSVSNVTEEILRDIHHVQYVLCKKRNAALDE